VVEDKGEGEFDCQFSEGFSNADASATDEGSEGVGVALAAVWFLAEGVGLVPPVWKILIMALPLTGIVMELLHVEHNRVAFAHIYPAESSVLREDRRSGLGSRRLDPQTFVVALEQVLRLVGDLHRELFLEVVSDWVKVRVDLCNKTLLHLWDEARVHDEVRRRDLDGLHSCD